MPVMRDSRTFKLCDNKRKRHWRDPGFSVTKALKSHVHKTVRTPGTSEGGGSDNSVVQMVWT
jgi:hypothetical protein